MDENVLSALDRSLSLARRLEWQMRQDSSEMEECVRGEVLTEYQSAIDEGVQLLRRIQWRLQELYEEQRQQM